MAEEADSMDDQFLGRRVRELRKLRQMTTRELGRLAGISSGYVSQIENGQANASLQVIRAIAESFGVPWIELFSESPKRAIVLRKGERPHLYSGGGAHHYGLTRPPLGNVEAFISTYDPDAGVGDANYTHGDSQEICLVLRGRFRFHLDDQEFILEEGDSIDFRTSTPHMIVNIGDEVGEALWIVSPPSDPSWRDERPE